MKKIYLAFAIAAATAISSIAAAAPAPNYSVTTDFTYTSRYVFRGVKNAGPSFQPSIEATADNLNLGLWTNQPITKNTNNEIDFYGGYTYTVTPQFKLEGVGTYYWYPEAHPSLGQTQNSYEAGIGGTYTAAGLSPSVYYYHDFRLDADTLQGAVGYSVPFEAIGASIDFTAFLGTVNADDGAPDSFGPKVHDSYMYYGGDLSVPYKLSTNATLTLGVHYAENSNLSIAGGPGGLVSKRNLWFTAGVSVGF